tara:strand:- start:640 stop:891 length:252 start_codon:yes stop_codon:yes gene_type:complete
MKKIVLIPILLIIISCSGENAAEKAAFKWGWTSECSQEEMKVCECEVDKLLEKFSLSEIEKLMDGDFDLFFNEMEEITKECEG